MREHRSRVLRASGPFVLIALSLAVSGCHAETRPTVACLADPAYVPQDGATEVVVLGEVQLPGRVTYTSGLTLRGAIDTAGGLTPLAAPSRVRVVRGSAANACEQDVNVARIASGRIADPELRAGDLVYVGSREL